MLLLLLFIPFVAVAVEVVVLVVGNIVPFILERNGVRKQAAELFVVTGTVDSVLAFKR